MLQEWNDVLKWMKKPYAPKSTQNVFIHEQLLSEYLFS